MSRARQYLTYLVVRVAVCLLQMLRGETFEALAPRFAYLCDELLRLRRDVVDESLAIALGESDEPTRRKVARRMWEHLFLLIGEVALLDRKVHPTNWRRYLNLCNGQQTLGYFMSGRPMVIVSGHFGNFELGNYALGLLGVPTLAVARELDNEFLDAWLRRFRGRTGQRMVDKIGGYDEIVATLERGGAVTLLGDQYAGSRGCWVDFFGRSASTHKAVALFALQYDAPLIVAYARRTRGLLHYDVGIHSLVDPRDQTAATSGVKPLTQWFTSQLEAIVRVAPEQYWWVHRRWKDHRNGAHTAR